LIKVHIEFLEEKMKIKDKVRQLRFVDKFFLQLYFLINLEKWVTGNSLTEYMEKANENVLVIENDVNLKQECGNNDKNNKTEILKSLQSKIEESKRLISKYINQLKFVSDNERKYKEEQRMKNHKH
jgi:hypothetical protein